jgi:hypothetical protein
LTGSAFPQGGANYNCKLSLPEKAEGFTKRLSAALRSVRVVATYEKVGLTPRYSCALHLSIFEQPQKLSFPCEHGRDKGIQETEDIFENQKSFTNWRKGQ